LFCQVYAQRYIMVSWPSDAQLLVTERNCSVYIKKEIVSIFYTMCYIVVMLY
jgi:hypothetical protein